MALFHLKKNKNGLENTIQIHPQNLNYKLKFYGDVHIQPEKFDPYNKHNYETQEHIHILVQ